MLQLVSGGGVGVRGHARCYHFATPPQTGTFRALFLALRKSQPGQPHEAARQRSPFENFLREVGRLVARVKGPVLLAFLFPFSFFFSSRGPQIVYGICCDRDCKHGTLLLGCLAALMVTALSDVWICGL